MIDGLLLAGGASSRFGSDKLTARLAGRQVIRWSADAMSSAVDRMLVVVPPGAQRLRDALAGLTVEWVVNERASTGLASSIQAGVSALRPETEAVIIALADQPMISRDVMVLLTERWRGGDVQAVAARYGDGRGHPVLFGRSLFAGLAALEGDQGARALLDGLGTALALVEVAGPRPADVDTPDALAALEARLRTGQP